jgi:hypothetical protein
MSQIESIEQANQLIRRCLDGFGAYIHGRKLSRRQRDKLREDLQQYLEGQRVRTMQPKCDVPDTNCRNRS